MNTQIVGYTVAEVFAMVKESNIPLKRSSVEAAFDHAGNSSPYSLDVSFVTPKLRVATPESVEKWLAYRKEKYGVRQGTIHPDDCKLIHRKTAWRTFMKDALKGMPKETHDAVKQAALTALKQNS